jgi:hypothetical protein
MNPGIHGIKSSVVFGREENTGVKFLGMMLLHLLIQPMFVIGPDVPKNKKIDMDDPLDLQTVFNF